MIPTSVVHIDLDSFFVSCERLENPDLIGKPVIVGGKSDRGVVASCSYEARRFGVRSAMPTKAALKRCPEAVVVKGSMGVYSKYSQVVTEIIKEKSPEFEKASIDEFYIDTSGMDTYFNCYQWAQELRQTIIRETRLPISFCLASGKTMAKIGTGEAKPNGSLEIVPGEEKRFLAPLSVNKIPMVGKKAYEKLQSLGIETIGALQTIPRELLEHLFGKGGRALWKKAQGQYRTPITPYRTRKSISSSMTLGENTQDITHLHNILRAMVEKLAHGIRKEKKLTGSVAVTIRYANFTTKSKQRVVSYTANDTILSKTALDLFDALYEHGNWVRLVGVRFGNLLVGGYQTNLFQQNTLLDHLHHTMDDIKGRFGHGAIQRANTIGGGRWKKQ